MELTLRDGTTTKDPRLDRLVQFDERSRAFRAVSGLETKPQRSFTWSCKYFLDQGREGACVGFSVSHEIGARPLPLPVTEGLALQIYRAAQKIDPWPGENYSGTSVLAGVKTAHDMGYFGEYRWAFGLDDLILSVGYKGPAILGINWKEGMFTPDEKGFIHATGSTMGGHAILCNGVNVRKRFFRLHNSWGNDWGKDGACFISFEDMGKLLAEQGEACIPVVRKRLA